MLNFSTYDIVGGGAGGPELLHRQRQVPWTFQRPLTEGGEGGWGLWMVGTAIMDRGGNTFFFASQCERRSTILSSFAPQGKNQAMPEHEQVMPPYNCIARVAAGE